MVFDVFDFGLGVRLYKDFLQQTLESRNFRGIPNKLKFIVILAQNKTKISP